MSRSDVAAVRKPELIVCSIDYDGCISGRDMGDGAINMRAHLHGLLIQHPQASLVLMVGSARQSIVSDWCHERTNKNGSCWVFLKSFLGGFQSIYPDLADRISLDPFLLEDISRKKNPGHHFDVRVNAFSEALGCEYAQRATHFKNGIDIEWQDLTKKSLIYAQLHYIGMKHPGKNIVFNFYDDRVCILEALYDLYQFQIELIPNNFSLHLFNYVAGDFKGQISLDIAGIGFVDNNYSANVKKLHLPDWLSSHHAHITNRVLNEPNMALAIHLYRFSPNKNDFICRLRETWGTAVFDFLDHIDIRRTEKIMLVAMWLPDAIKLKEIEFIRRCVREAHPNTCVEYFIDALEKNDDVLAAVFSPILDSPDLGALSRNNIISLLFLKKNTIA